MTAMFATLFIARSRRRRGNPEWLATALMALDCFAALAKTARVAE